MCINPGMPTGPVRHARASQHHGYQGALPAAPETRVVRGRVRSIKLVTFFSLGVVTLWPVTGKVEVCKRVVGL